MSESEKRFNEGRYSTLPKSEFPSGSPEWEGAQIRDTIRQRNEKGWGQWNQQISGQPQNQSSIPSGGGYSGTQKTSNIIGVLILLAVGWSFWYLGWLLFQIPPPPMLLSNDGRSSSSTIGSSPPTVECLVPNGTTTSASVTTCRNLNGVILPQ